jgi:D-glycero-D-manno-heptose 1,7-bisphosphate phosphatase
LGENIFNALAISHIESSICISSDRGDNHAKHCMNVKKRYVILDRDGTIIEERHYLSDPDAVQLLFQAAVGLRHMQELGFGLIVITNQSAVGRGLFSEARLAEIHARMEDLLAVEGVRLDGIYSCPHRPEDNCCCRKPEPGLVDLAARQLAFDPGACVVIGDKRCDIELGRRIGAVTILVRTGYGVQEAATGAVAPDHIVDNLYDAAKAISTWMR